MKKNVLLVAAVFFAAFAATEVQAQDFKPAAGEKTIEVNFAPLGGNPISINELRFRSFTSATTALRLGISIAYSRSNEALQLDTFDFGTPGAPDYEIGETVDHNSEFGITLMPGYEKHFAGTDRLSPYIGGVATIGYYSTTETDEIFGDTDGSVDADGNGSAYDDRSQLDVYENKTKDGRMDLGLNLVLGADWYFSPKIYLGMEVGFGFLYSNTRNTEFEYGQKVPEPDNRTEEVEQGSEFNLGPNYNAGIRLGYAF